MTGRQAPTKEAARRSMDEAWAALGEALAGLGDAELQEPGVVGGWSLKDVMGHIAFWAQQATSHTKMVKEGRQGQIVRPDSPETTDRWNEREQRLRAARPLAEVRREMEESHQGALAALADLPEEKLSLNMNGGVFLELYAIDTYDHYREHTEQILAWRRDRQTTRP